MIENLKDLQKLLKLCRAQGVSKISLGTVTLEFGDMPRGDLPELTTEQEIEEAYLGFPDGELTPEELTFFANGGLPEDNPYRNKN